MANSYIGSSFSIPVKDMALTKERMVALRAWIEDEDADFPFPEIPITAEQRRELLADNLLEFKWEVSDGELGLYQTEWMNIEQAVAVAQLMLALEGDDAVYTAEWAITCDKPRTDAFGGGAVAFSRRGSEWGHTGEMARQLKQKLEAA